jgi:hypothetical protein
MFAAEHRTHQQPTSPIAAPLTTPGSVSPRVQIFSRGQPEGAVRSTASNLPYASVTEAGPYASASPCTCGQPSHCAPAPFLGSSLSHAHP